MIDKNTMKPHISYDTLSESWLCSSEHGPWDICIGAGETPLMAYRSWESKCPRMVVETPKHWSWQGCCENGGKWRLQ